MRERELTPPNGALDDTSDSLGAGIRTLRGALLTDLVVARHVLCSDVRPALGLAHRPVFKHKIAEHPRLAVVSIRA